MNAHIQVEAAAKCPLCGLAFDNSKQLPIDNKFAEFISGIPLDPPDMAVRSCAHCGHTCLYPSPTEAFLAAFYSRYMSTAVDGFYRDRVLAEIPLEFRKRYGRVLREIAATNRPGRTLLDMGAGAGMFLRLAREHGFEVSGLEPNAEAAARLREQFTIPCIVGTVENFEADEQYDVITMWDLLEHLRDPRQALRKVRKHLKPDGLLVVETPLRDSLVNRLAVLLYRCSAGLVSRPMFLIYGVHHLHYFSVRGLGDLLEEEGFSLASARRAETDFSSLKHRGAGVLGRTKAALYNAAIFLVFWAARLLCYQNKIIIVARLHG